jgi:hypothetical protein
MGKARQTEAVGFNAETFLADMLEESSQLLVGGTEQDFRGGDDDMRGGDDDMGVGHDDWSVIEEEPECRAGGSARIGTGKVHVRCF